MTHGRGAGRDAATWCACDAGGRHDRLERDRRGHRRLDRLAAIAVEIDDRALGSEIAQERVRLSEARFFVACVGQFKRGKSTLLNALVGDDVLPTGMVPVTSIVTILRYGDVPGAGVWFGPDRSERIPLTAVSDFVDERRNGRNHKSASVVEIRLPSPLLRDGLCLVDTPGIGSILADNTAATRAFVPRVDVVLAVVGPDPPIAADELDLIQEAMHEARELIVVINKADRLDEHQAPEVITFTRQALEERLRVPVPQILCVSALERLEGRVDTRDWAELRERIARLSRDDRGELLAAAASRAEGRFVERLRGELATQEAALVRPLIETEARAVRLRDAAVAIDRSLRDLHALFDVVEAELGVRIADERRRFVADTWPDVGRDLEAWVRRHSREHGRRGLRASAAEHARQVARRTVEAWLRDREPFVGALYEDATARFLRLANEFVSRLTADVPALTRDEAIGEAHLGARSQFYFANLMYVGAAGPLALVLDRVTTRSRHESRVCRAIGAYLAYLLETNSYRVENDFKERTRESRLALERAIRARLREAGASAERALALALQRRRMTEGEIAGRVGRLRSLAADLDGRLASARPDRPA